MYLKNFNTSAVLPTASVPPPHPPSSSHMATEGLWAQPENVEEESREAA